MVPEYTEGPSSTKQRRGGGRRLSLQTFPLERGAEAQDRVEVSSWLKKPVREELAQEGMRSVDRGPGIGPLGLGGTTDGESKTSCGSSQACSLDAPLHTEQQVVPEERGQWEAGSGLSAAAPQLGTHSQAGQVLQPPRLVHHAQGRAVEGFVLLGQEWNRVRWPNTVDSAFPTGGQLVVEP